MLIRSTLALGPHALAGDLCLVDEAPGLVLFVHGRDSSRISPRSLRIAQRLQAQSLSTLLVDFGARAGAGGEPTVADALFLAERLREVLDDLPPEAARLPLGLMGSGTGGAAALTVAAERPAQVRAVVCRSARTDLAAPVLADVLAPTLLIAGGADPAILQQNREAYGRLRGTRRIDAVPRATHLFLEAGTLEAVALKAAEWFRTHLPPTDRPAG